MFVQRFYILLLFVTFHTQNTAMYRSFLFIFCNVHVVCKRRCLCWSVLRWLAEYISLLLLDWTWMVERATGMSASNSLAQVGNKFHSIKAQSKPHIRHSSYVKSHHWCQGRSFFHTALFVSCHFVLATIQVQVCALFRSPCYLWWKGKATVGRPLSLCAAFFFLYVWICRS